MEGVMQDYIERFNSIEDVQAILDKHRTMTVKFICDRGVSHELVRHRPCSFAQESTRYCNYGKDKFSNELTFIIPSQFNQEYLKNLNPNDLITNDPNSTFPNVLYEMEIEKIDYINVIKIS
jgi:hypothetical protein